MSIYRKAVNNPVTTALVFVANGLVVIVEVVKIEIIA